MKAIPKVGEPQPRRQVWIRHGEFEAEIDTRLAPIILECWKRDIWAISSCEGRPNENGFIQFQTSADAIAFLNAVCTKSKSYTSLYARAEPAFVGMAPPRKAGYRSWDIEAVPYDCGFKGETSDFELTVSINFPRRDIPRMLKALRLPTRLSAVGSRARRRGRPTIGRGPR